MEGVMLQLQKASMCSVMYWREYKTAHAQPKQKAFDLMYSSSKKKKKKREEERGKKENIFLLCSIKYSRHHMTLWILLRSILCVHTILTFFGPGFICGHCMTYATQRLLKTIYSLQVVYRNVKVNHISSSALGIAWSSWTNKMVQFISTVTALLFTSFCLVSY